MSDGANAKAPTRQEIRAAMKALDEIKIDIEEIRFPEKGKVIKISEVKALTLRQWRDLDKSHGIKQQTLQRDVQDIDKAAAFVAKVAGEGVTADDCLDLTHDQLLAVAMAVTRAENARIRFEGDSGSRPT